MDGDGNGGINEGVVWVEWEVMAYFLKLRGGMFRNLSYSTLKKLCVNNIKKSDINVELKPFREQETTWLHIDHCRAISVDFSFLMQLRKTSMDWK